MFPNAPVYMTQATLDISRVMLADALRLSSQDGQPRVFQDIQLDELWTRIHVMGQDQMFGWNGIRVSTFSAGHILGAVALGFETQAEGSVLVTGDYAVAPGRLIGGLRIPKGMSFDTVITESTYGARLHENRANQEKALAEQVSAVIENGGFVLIPAFAVGRAQEVLMILQDAMRYNKEIKPFRLVVDGLVRSICPIYESYPHLLQGPAKRLLRSKGRLFAPDDIQFVKKPEERQQVVQGDPACIISSSGMLTGGPSVFYADMLAAKEKNAIFLCGYQDEESPGRLLLDLAKQEPEQRKWILPDRVVPVRAQVGLYSLSAHADRRELTQLVTDIRPQSILLVHGDQESKQGLARELRSYLPQANIEIVEVGLTYEVAGRIRKHLQVPAEERPVRADIWQNQILLYKNKTQQELSLGICKEVHGGTCTVFSAKGESQRIPVGLVVDAFGRVPSGEDASDFMDGLWQAAEASIAEGRMYGYRPAERLAYHIAEAQDLLVPVDPYGGDEVAELLAPYGWRKTEPVAEQRVFKAYVSFPWAIPSDIWQTIEKKEQTGWRYEISPHVYPPAVNRLVEEQAKLLDVVALTPKIYPQDHRIVVPLQGRVTDVQRQHMEQSLTEKIGGTVLIQLLEETNGERGQGEEGTGTGSHPVTRMEQNEALRRVKQLIPESFGLHKAGLDQLAGTIKIALLFPDAVVHRPEATAFAARIEQETGWKIEWMPSVNQAQLAKVALASVEQAGGAVKGSPAIYLERKEVGVQLTTRLSVQDMEASNKLFHEQTGWQLRFAGEQQTYAQPLADVAAVHAAHRQADANANTTANGDFQPFQFLPQTTSERMEINRALQWIDEDAAGQGIQIYKKSLRNERIEITFITPEWGQSQPDWLQRIADHTGWTVAVADKVQQQALIALAEQLASDFQLSKTPSVYLMRKAVGVRMMASLPVHVVEMFHDLTLWDLVQE
ncbi:MBL fold metallo-hydrolase [Fodinisporobacter ferrooxydans]|uniref:MBL fold metallo-hydrolase n=1 Tax=Fodinisporobacter ferrooxydans TaxID=2901836 RepID=A0ABY4CTR3_9BACL|nr:MBL fold metallo-hydrolase [Alicyclobacillaceae bacterium MYW30-H2]